MKARFYLQQAAYGRGVEVRLVDLNFDGQVVGEAQPVTFKSMPDQDEALGAPLVVIRPEAAQNLMDELWLLGFPGARRNVRGPSGRHREAPAGHALHRVRQARGAQAVKRTAIMSRGTGFKRPERVRPPMGPLTPVTRGVVVMCTGMALASPKFPYIRSKRLREAYRLLPCQYDDNGVLCGCKDGTVCCNHSNWGIHGKGKTIKASDDRGASGCYFHHSMLDQGSKWSEEEKQARWWRAHQRSVRLLVATGQWPKAIPVPDIENFPFERDFHAYN